MYKNPVRQNGGSAIVNLILLAAFAYAVFVGIQWAPQWVEARSLKSILNDVRQTQATDPATTVQGAKEKVVKRLQINEMDDMIKSLDVSGSNGRFLVTFSYDRELNLLYQTRTVHYEHSVSL